MKGPDSQAEPMYMYLPMAAAAAAAAIDQELASWCRALVDP